MCRRVRDFIEIGERGSLDDLIDQLTEIRSGLPEDAEPEIRLRGDDVFGRHLCVTFWRPQTAEEAEIDARYSGVCADPFRESLELVHERLGFCPLPRIEEADLKDAA